MPRTKLKVNTSWMSNFAQQGSNLRFLDEIDYYDRDLQREIQESADRTARNLYDIEQTRADIKFLEEDPEGYFYEKEQRELERSEKTFANYRKNWWASHGRKMNDFQAQDFQGYMDRADQWERLANDVKSYWDIEDEIKNIDSQLAQWRLNTQNVGKMPISKAREAYGAIEVLETLKEALQQRMEELKPSVEAFKTYVPGALKTGYLDLVAGNGNNSIFSNNRIFGRTSQAHDELGDITRFTSSIFSPKRSRGEQRAMLDKALKAKQEKYAEWKDAFDKNIQDKESYNKVDRWFQRKEENAGTDIFNADTWLYGMPGLIAGSTSGLSKIIPATITGALTAAATYATGGLAALGIGAAGGLGTFGLNYGAGVSENNAEVAMAYSDRIKDYLKSKDGSNGSLYDDVIKEGRRKLNMDSISIDDDQVFEQWRNGKYDISNAKVNKELAKLAVGMESQFQDDMAATTWSAGLETMLQILPIGRVLSVPKPLRFLALKSAAGRKALRNGVIQSLANGYEVGSVASPLLGAAYAPLHALMSPTAKKVGKAASSVIDDISRTAFMTDDLPKQVLARQFKRDARNRYFKDIAGRWALASASEGVEEGKQHISAERYKNGYYTDAKIKSIGDTILDDFLAGSKSAGLLLGMPFEGLMSEKDREVLREIKGGFILGGLQTGVVNVSTSIAPYMKQRSATSAIVNTVLLDKASKLDRFNKSRTYANMSGSAEAYQNMVDAFDRLKEVNQREFDATGEYGVAPEDIDEELNAFKSTAIMAVDGYTVKQAKAQGIDPQSNEYRDFVAAKSLTFDELKDAADVAAEASKNFSAVSTQIKLDVLLERSKATEEGEEYKPTSVAQYSSDQNFKQLQTVAEYAALLRRKQQLEVGIMNAESGNHERIKTILKKQLSEIDDRIKNMRSVVSSYTHEDESIDIDNLESVEKSLVLNRDAHDNLSEAYRLSIVADQDYELALDLHEKVVGKAYLDGKEVDLNKETKWDEVYDEVEFKGGKAKDVIREIQDTINDDDDLASAIDEDFEDRTDNEGNEIITPEDAKKEEEKVPVNDPAEEARADREKEFKENDKPIPQPSPQPVPKTPVEPILKPIEPISPVEPPIVPPEPPKGPVGPENAPLEEAKREPTQKLKDTIAKLNNLAEQSKKNVKAVTPTHYVVTVDGKDVEMPRVHSVMPEYWTSTTSNPAPLQVGNVFDNLARIFFGDKDNMVRYETDKSGLIERLYDQLASHKDNPNDPSVNKINKLKFKDVFPVQGEFEKTIDDMYALAKEYDKMGWELSTEPIVWSVKFPRGWVAGETDMVAVDRDGKIHIIDFKTAKSDKNTTLDPFSHQLGSQEIRITKPEHNDRLLELNKDDFTTGPRKKGLSKKARSLIQDIRKDKKSRNLTLVWDDADSRAKVYGIGSKYTAAPSSNQRVSHLYEYTDPTTGEKKSVVKGSKMYEYSDQLTAYQEMIKRSIPDVAGMEVIGFRVGYSIGEDNNLASISSIRNEVNGKPFRNLVGESSEMIERLNKPSEPVQPQPEVGPTQPETVQNNEDDNAIKDKELKKLDKTINKPKEDSPKPMSVEEAQQMLVEGRANINVNNLKQHPELVQGLVFDKEFIAEAIANGTVEVYVEDAEYKGKPVPTVYADVTYKGKTYKHLFVYDNQSLIDKVKALQSIKKPGLKIVATNITRTAGEPKRTDSRPVLDASLVDESLSEVTFESSKRQFGFVKNGKVVGFAGNNQNMQDPIHDLQGITLPNGTFVYLKRIPRSQSEGGDILWPVVIAENNLLKDGDFIIDCLKNIDLLDTPYIMNINGQDVSIGATRRDLLNLLIPYQDDWNRATTTFSIIRDNNQPSRFGIIDSKKQMITYVDLRNQESINKFKESLSKIQVVDNHGVLASSIGNPSADPVFTKIKKFFATNKNGIKAIDISPSIKFDMEDFRGDGLSGMAWYLKRGMFTTNYNGMDSPLVSINDVGLQDKPVEKKQEEAKKSPIDPVLPDPNEGFDPSELGVFSMGVNKVKKIADRDKPTLTADQIKKHLRPILGDIVDDPTVVTIIEDLYSDPRLKTAAVVGKATADGITLYNGAFEYVDYHEAFHRIFELFVPSATRNAIYQRVAKQLEIDLKKSTSKNNFAGHRAIAEYLADKYMDHRRYNISTNYNWLNKIINWISDVVRMLFNIGERDIYKVFLDINSGKYRNKTLPSKESVERFNKLFGNLNYEIRGQRFEHIANDPMYEELKNSMFFCLLRGLHVDLSGSTVQNTVVSREAVKRGADTLKKFGYDVFGTDVEHTDKSAVQLAMTEMLVKFDAVADDLASMMATVSTDYRKIMQDDGREDADGGESQSSYDENFLKWSYEFDKFDKTTSRVKFFFATIPDSEYVDDTKTKQRFATNTIGLPLFIPMNYVFNEVLSSLWDIDTIEEAVSRLTTLAMDDPMYAHILGNLLQVINSRRNADGTVNADAEALLTLLMNTIRSNRHTFMLLRSVSKAEGKYDIVIQRSDADYNARVFPQQWSQVLVKGGSETLKIDQYGSLVFNPKAKDSAKTFATIAKFFDDLKDAVSSVNSGVKEITIPQYSIGDYEYEDTMGNRTVEAVYMPAETVPDIIEPANFKKVVAGIIEAFNRVGINIHTEEFNYMLRHKYGASDWEGLKQMLQSTDKTESIGSFLFFLNNITINGKLNISEEGMFRTADGKEVRIDNVYSSMAFVRELGNWKYEYRHAHDQLSVLATGGNRFYEMSDNDYMSDVLRNLNKRGKWFNDLKNDPYNYCVIEDNFGETLTYGSITLDLLTKNPDMKLQLKHFIGFKTDKKNDEGRDYFEISRREDWLSKVGILENDGMISLTLSDKKKYCYITGVKLPGIDYSAILKAEEPIIDLNAVSQDVFVPDGVASAVYTIQQREEVVNQFLSYARSEYQAILRNAARLNDGHRQVANFDTEGQGLRFSSLLGVYEPTFGADGKPNGEQFISFNDSRHDWQDDLHMAEIHFFDKTEDEQKALIARILSKQAEKELENAAEMGLIQRVGNHNNPMYNYINKGLNDKVIQSLTNSYMEKMKNDQTFTADMAHSMAIVVYINDISNKAIMSGQEMERLFSGNPAFYKWKYDDYGHLVDRTVDELKRLGGLGSTGVNNFTQLLDMPSKYLDKNGNFTGKYVAAEADNEKVASPQYEEMAKRMYEGQLRSDIINTVTADLVKQANTEYESRQKDLRRYKNELTADEYAASVAEIEKWFADRLLDIEKEAASSVDSRTVEELEKDYPSAVENAKTRAGEVSKALASGIDVADGGAYISDVMCEMLLRMEGAYSKEIQEAFKILRGEVKVDFLSLIDAYQKVLTSVIGNQKYTAFGRRLQDGKSVPYYHKMALFPIFECIATGRMKNIFDKMNEQGIDMLLVNSAVKVGSEGSKPINWDDYREDDDKFNGRNYVNNHVGQKIKPIFKEAFNFNTYECEFDYLRKQLNTDPKEEEMLRMGTQMQKVVYSNLVPGRTYTKQNGETLTGRALLNEIMDSSNKLSDLGVDKLNKRFFKTNENGELIDRFGNVIEDRNSNDREIDIVKFSKEVSKLMSDRGADKNIMKALEVVTSSAGDQLSIPLGAISNANWLESVLISTINKDVVDVNTPGAFFIQRSVWAMEGLKMYDGKKNVKGDQDDAARKLYDGKRLQMVNEEGSMDCVLSLDFFKDVLPQVETGEFEVDEETNKIIQEYRESLKKNNPELTEQQIEEKIKAAGLQENAYVYRKDDEGNFITDERGFYIPKKKMRDMTFTEARKWLLRHGIIGGKANIVAYRIPTQAESSIHALRCVDVLPVVRDTVILPQEFTKITGSDFDIDKLGLSTVNWKKNGSDQFKEGTEQYYQNKLIRDYITLLIDPRTQHILHRSIDNDTKLLKDVLKEIESGSAQQETPYGFYSLSTQTTRKDDYITGKIGIGPFALNNNSHILTMLYGVRFKDIPNTIMSDLGLTDLSIHNDKDGNSIMSWLSALINAHVDIAKDPYISRLNVNSFTYNLVNTLIRTGFGKDTFYFTTQPIMKELAAAYNNAASSYMADQYKSQYQLQQEAVLKVAEDRFANVEINGWKFEDIVKGITDPKNVGYRPVINAYIKSIIDDGVLKNNANKSYGEVTGATVPKVTEPGFETLSPEQVQALMYLAYLQFDPYALSVSNLVKYSKIDTKKHGKSYIEQQVFLKGFKKLFYNEDGGGLFEEQGLDRLSKQSYIKLKTINAISMTKNILKGQFLQSTNAFDAAIQNILGMIGKKDSLSVDLWKTVSQAIMASVKSEYINQYAQDLPQYNNTYMHDLVSESEETLSYTQKKGSNRVKITGTPKYNLKSYVNKPAVATFDYNDKTYTPSYIVIGYDEESNELILNRPVTVDNTGSIHLTGGANTIYDRFNRLAIELRDNPDYHGLLDASGEPANMLLKSLVPGNEFTYVAPLYEYTRFHEESDTYETLKFIKLFNALDQNGPESNFIIDAWDQLLHDNNHPMLKKFAEDLVVYAFITSGDQGGFTKFFKQVPYSWRKESGYADFITRKLVEFQDPKAIGVEQLEDAILNNWFDSQFVPKYNEGDFITYTGENKASMYASQLPYPSVMAALKLDNGIYTPSIDPENAPLFIKIPRRKDYQAKDSQRRVTVYRRMTFGMRRQTVPNGAALDGTTIMKEKWVHFPIYVKVEPKGNKIRGNYLMTEYGREDALNKEYTPSEQGMRDMFAIGDIIADSEVQAYSDRFGNIFAQMIQDMNYNDALINVYDNSMKKFTEALNKHDKPVILKQIESISGPAKEKSNTTLTNFISREDRIKWNRENVSDKIHYLIFERSTAEKQKNVLYIFTDNTDRTSGSGQINPNSWYALKYGLGLKFPTKTTAVVRGLDNARPVSTQRWYHDGAKGEAGRWNDSDFEEFKKVIDAEFVDIFEAWDTGQYDWIAVPMSSSNGGYRLGLYYGKISQITPERTPKLFEYLQDKMAELNEHLVGRPRLSENPNVPKQLELFEGVDQSEIDELKKEAEEIKKQCKGK